MFLWDTDLDFVTTAVSLVATIVSLTTTGSSFAIVSLTTIGTTGSSFAIVSLTTIGTTGSSFAIVSLTTTGTTGSSFAITATISLSIDFVEATEGRVTS